MKGFHRPSGLKVGGAELEATAGPYRLRATEKNIQVL